MDVNKLIENPQLLEKLEQCRKDKDTDFIV